MFFSHIVEAYRSYLQHGFVLEKLNTTWHYLAASILTRNKTSDGCSLLGTCRFPPQITIRSPLVAQFGVPKVQTPEATETSVKFQRDSSKPHALTHVVYARRPRGAQLPSFSHRSGGDPISCYSPWPPPRWMSSIAPPCWRSPRPPRRRRRRWLPLRASSGGSGGAWARRRRASPSAPASRVASHSSPSSSASAAGAPLDRGRRER